ncbi:MAG: NUDIX domain-containing protein [Bacteroidales bacterium]|nr:NUDIX domain-containing protein [Bacteroidales bacterium]
MNKITIYRNNRKIILWETTPEFEDMVENLEIDEPFIHKCNDRTDTILNTFFEKEAIKEISFEHPDLNKLFNDIKLYFNYIEAAGGLVKNKNNELLVIQRFDIPDLPKGKIEKNEKPEDAAIREVEEECGITGLKITGKAEPSYHIYTIKNKKVLKKTHWFYMNYAGDETLKPQTEEDITKVEWCDKSTAKKYKQKTYAGLKTYFEI